MSLLLKCKGEVMSRSRTKKLDHFYTLCDKEVPVLDVGVSSNEHSPAVNMFLKEFRFSPRCYTGLAVQSLEGIAPQHPGKRFVEYPGGRFPFDDKEFEWVFSNAVIEHVGDEAAQLVFVNEMVRVGQHVFFTTPNRYFPYESHTDALFIHWLPGEAFYRWCEGNGHWHRTNLQLFSSRRLKSLMAESKATCMTIQKNRFLGWPMTFTVICAAGGAGE